jgi:hypothetical protein
MGKNLQFCMFFFTYENLLEWSVSAVRLPLRRRVISLACPLPNKWERPYSVVRGFVSARMSIAIVRATHLCLRGSRVPLSQISRRPQWEDRAGLGLFKTDY